MTHSVAAADDAVLDSADIAATPASDGPSADLGQRVSRGLGWSLLGQMLARLGTFASGIILARLLAPIDFGEVAAALVVVNVLLCINELGVIPAIVRWRGDIELATATATTIALVTSFFMYGVAFCIAPAVAHLTLTPGSTWVIRIMALTVLVDGVVAIPLALLYRGLRTVPLVTGEVVGMAAYVVVAVWLATRGVDAEAVAWGRVVGAVVTAAILISVSRWPSWPAFDRSVARSAGALRAPPRSLRGALRGGDERRLPHRRPRARRRVPRRVPAGLQPLELAGVHRERGHESGLVRGVFGPDDTIGTAWSGDSSTPSRSPCR